MKTIYIIRHAKSSWKDINISDMDRPLKKRGRSDSKEIATKLLEEGVKPDVIYTSPALRAYDTAKVFTKYMKLSENDIQVMDKLYLPDFGTLLKTVLYLNNDLNCVFIFGHEPSLSTFVNYFIEKPLEKLVTSSVTKMEFDTDTWKDVAATTLKSAFHRNRHDWDGFELK